MTKNTTDNVATTETSGHGGEDTVGKPVRPERAQSGRLAASIAILALITAISGIGAGYSLYSRKIQPLFKLPATIEEIQQHSARKLTELDQQMATHLAETTRKVDLLQEGDTLNQQRFHGIEENLDKIRGQAFWSTREWKLAEIRYLVQIAQDRIQLMHDTTTAETALVAALGRLAELADPSLEPLRQRLQHDIQRINTPSDEDPLTVIGKLEELVASVKPYPRTKPDAVDKGEPSDQEQVAQSPLDVITTIIKSRVQIVHHDQSLNALDRNRVAGYQLELLKLRVEALRLSLIQRNSKAYEHELNGIKLWLAENSQIGLTGKIRAEVDRLQHLKPFAPAPSLQPTLDSLGGLLSNNLHLPAGSDSGDAS